jgi:hypothetical protein
MDFYFFFKIILQDEISVFQHGCFKSTLNLLKCKKFDKEKKDMSDAWTGSMGPTIKGVK